jgi:hypothetical protein
MDDHNTIDLGSITIDLSSVSDDGSYYAACDTIYTSGTTDTITLLDHYKSNSSDFSDINIDWFEDQRIVNEYNEEKAIRERNPGIQEAWEQYKILVELAKNPPENID